MNNAGGDRIYSIQFLRGVAAFLVVTTHALNEFGIKVAGAVGVDLFFAISGFVMYYVTADGVRNFLVRRAIRILPLYYLVTTGLFLLV
jgi:exopolysaccharide production protein ExoZ